MEVKTTKDLPCLDCLDNCEAKQWLTKAYELDNGGFKVKAINLPCPKNKVTYLIKRGG